MRRNRRIKGSQGYVLLLNKEPREELIAFEQISVESNMFLTD
jgi:hypothetical protein